MHLSVKESQEQRLKTLEDMVAIQQIVCGYGYAVDGCNAEAVGSFYSEHGVYAVGDVGSFEGRHEVAGITDRPGHRKLVSEGCGHLSTIPYIVLDGDRATATCHTMLVRHGESGFYIDRLSASRIELVRDPVDGWQIAYRQNYMLDGTPEGPHLLARLLDASPSR